MKQYIDTVVNHLKELRDRIYGNSAQIAETKDNDMSLPEGKTCEDCFWFFRCSALFMCDPGSDSCDFDPSRFKDGGCNHLYRAIDQTRSQCAKCGEIK